jgi:hypothetical protein
MNMKKRWEADDKDPGFLKPDGNIPDLLIHVSSQQAISRKKLIADGMTENQVEDFIRTGIYEEVIYE